MCLEIKIETIHKINEAAAKFVEILNDLNKNKILNVVAFYGKMGVGKTTFIREIAAQMGVKDVVNSPTFAIVNEYTTENGENIYHFDLYRINSDNEAYDIGYEDYVYSNNYCFLEWPEKIQNLLPPQYIAVFITEEDDSSRTVKITVKE
jgi:tRNA threonylcarbamoyladenosine biosynthesis protein TsaE